MRVVVGSLNPTKVGAARTVFQQVWPECQVTGIEVALPESVSEMPIGDQVRAGARFRAQAALEHGAEFGVGAEGGVLFADGRAYLMNWCAVADRDGRLFDSPSPYVLLPTAWEEAIRNGLELGPYLARLTGDPDINKKGGAVGLLTGGQLTRQEFFEQALLCALAPVLASVWYM